MFFPKALLFANNCFKCTLANGFLKLIERWTIWQNKNVPSNLRFLYLANLTIKIISFLKSFFYTLKCSDIVATMITQHNIYDKVEFPIIFITKKLYKKIYYIKACLRCGHRLLLSWRFLLLIAFSHIKCMLAWEAEQHFDATFTSGMWC